MSLTLKAVGEAIKKGVENVVGVDEGLDEKQLQASTVEAILDCRPMKAVRTRIKKICGPDDWDLFAETVLSWGDVGISPEWKFLLTGIGAVGEEKDEKKVSASEYSGPKVTLDIPKYDGTPGKCALWWEKTCDVLMQLEYPEKDWFLPVQQALSGIASEDFWQFRTANRDTNIRELVKMLIRLYDVNRQRMLIAELLTRQQGGTFRKLRARLLKVFRGLEDYDWKFTDAQRVVWTSVLMKTELWSKIAAHKPTSVDGMLKIISELGLEPATSHALMTRGSPAVARHSIERSPRSPAVARGSQGVCFKLRDSGTCHYGEECRFSHSVDGQMDAGARKSTKPPSKPCPACGGRHWKRNCPKDQKTRSGTANSVSTDPTNQYKEFQKWQEYQRWQTQ